MYDADPELGDCPEFGMIFVLDADYSNVRWYGRGPEETYADRKRGGKLGIWENKVIDNMAEYLVPQECGNKEDVRWGEVTDDTGRGLRFTSLGAPMCFSALPYTPHEMENALHAHELDPERAGHLSYQRSFFRDIFPQMPLGEIKCGKVKCLGKHCNSCYYDEHYANPYRQPVFPLPQVGKSGPVADYFSLSFRVHIKKL